MRDQSEAVIAFVSGIDFDEANCFVRRVELKEIQELHPYSAVLPVLRGDFALAHREIVGVNDALNPVILIRRRFLLGEETDRFVERFQFADAGK